MGPRVERWDSRRYLQFEEERTLPCRDLVHRVALTNPARIVDLGCGTGSSTSVLRARWPAAHLTGLDSSPEMLEAARKSSDATEWVAADLRTWSATAPYDLVFSNAALQWLPDHRSLLPRLWSWVAENGGLAFQVPARSSPEPAWLAAVAALRARTPWDRLSGDDPAIANVLSPDAYYDVLGPSARWVEMWDTVYQHVFPDASSVLDWIQGTGLRPLLQQLPEPAARQRFLDELGRELADRYPLRADGRVVFPFLRRFAIAYR